MLGQQTQPAETRITTPRASAWLSLLDALRLLARVRSATSHFSCCSFFRSASEKTNSKRRYTTTANGHMWATA